MKNLFFSRVLTCLVALTLLWSARASAAAFTPGSIVVVRIGDGTAAVASGAAGATFLLEYSPTGTLLQTIALPTAVAGANHILTNTASSSSDGSLTRTADGRYLVLTGYDTAPGTTGILATTSTATNRVIGRVAADGTVNTSTLINDAFSTSNIRGAASADGSNFYAIGANSGVHYLPLGNTGTTTAFNTASPTNIRTVNIFGGNLYISSATGAFLGISQVGTGLPTTAPQTITALPGFPTMASAPSESPYAFYFADLSATVPGVDVVYIADDRLAAPGGVQKWSLVGGTWTFNGSIVNATAVRSITGSTSGTNVTLFAGTDANVYSFVDNTGYNAAFTVTALPTTALFTAASNTKFRGLALAPVATVATPAPTITSFTPTTGATGAMVTITGTNFTGATAVTLNGVAITGYTVVSATSITFTVPVTGATGTIAVTTPGGTATSSTSFTVTAATPAPTITSFTPAAGPVGTVVTVNGTNLTGATAATVNGTPGTNFMVMSATQVMFTVAAGSTTGLVRVTTPSGTAVSSTNFTVGVVTPAPTITSFTPTTGATGAMVTITGTNFTGATAVTLNGVAITGYTVVSATSITFTVPATGATGTIAVTTPGGTATSTGSFTVTVPTTPTLTTLSPARAVVGGPAFLLTVGGTNFTASTMINFRGVDYPVATLTSATSLTVNIPASAIATLGMFTVTASNGGTASGTLDFAVVAAATVPVFEDFEQGTSTSYTNATPVALRSGAWTFTMALLGDLFNDKVNQTKAARIRPTGSIAMNFDKANGAGIVTVNAALYGNDAAATFLLEMSTNGGTSYTAVAGAPTALTTTLTPYTFTVNRTGNVRFRISNTTASGTTPRINVDDVNITDYILATLPGRALPGLTLYPNPTQGRLTVALPQPGAAQVAVRDLTGRVVLPLAPLAADRSVTLPASAAAGVYLLEVRQGDATAVRRITKE